MRRIDNKKNVRFDKVHKKLLALSLCTQQEMSFSSSPSLKSYFFMAAKPKPEVKTAEQLVSLLERRRASEVKM